VAHPGARHGPGAGSTGFGEVVGVGVGMTCSVGYSGGGRFMALGVACVWEGCRVGTHMQLELGVQQRAAAVVVRAGEEAEDGLSLLMGVVSEHAPLMAGPAAEVLGDVISGWVDSLRAFTADLQGVCGCVGGC